MFIILWIFFLILSLTNFLMAVTLMDFNSVTMELLLPYKMIMEFPISISFDFMSLTYFFCVSVISSSMFLYSKFYMGDTMNKNNDIKRFYFLILLFVMSMMTLVFSNSWVTLMLGWDGLGLTSFLLVIYYNNTSSLVSGLLTVLTNRVGDCLFILSFLFMLHSMWTWVEFTTMSKNLMMLSTLIMLGAITKSAQFPFSSWLPAAMAAPTPVSSLVHSSTLVTAGVYVLLRFNLLISPLFPLMSLLSMATLILGGFCASMEMDFKKVVAMSTLSQLGFMIYSISSGYWMISFIHMTFHAFFKSCLFMSTGGLMHMTLGEQDSRLFGSLKESFISKMMFSMSCLSLMGFPFSMGFYSKDFLIMESLSSKSSFMSILFIIGCCFTVSYSFRLIYLGFSKYPLAGSEMSFKEDLMFSVPMILISMNCIFMSNFLFWNLAAIPLSPSALELLMGLIIILIGAIIFKTKKSSYWTLNLSSTMIFLNFFFSSFTSSKMKFNYFSTEQKWMEMMSGKGIENILSLIKTKFYFLTNFYLSVMIFTMVYLMMFLLLNYIFN